LFLTGQSGHGATVEARFWLMLDSNSFSSDYIISPLENKTVWTTGPVTHDNYSYALLNIHSSGVPLEDEKTRLNQPGRAHEWKQTVNSMAVIAGDRARIPGGQIGDGYDKIYSIHTSEEDAHWSGGVGRGDGSASFVKEDLQDTKYGLGPEIKADRLFAKEQDPAPKIDTLEHQHESWDDTANALLGYTAVGYEDPDIASE
jgi:hypothetical protein